MDFRTFVLPGPSRSRRVKQLIDGANQFVPVRSQLVDPAARDVFEHSLSAR